MRPYQPHETHLEVFDIGPPLRRRGGITLSVPLSTLHHTYTREMGIRAALVGESTVMLHPDHAGHHCGMNLDPCRPADAHVTLIDTANPDAPVVASRTSIPGATWATVAAISGPKLLVTHHQEPGLPSGDVGPNARFFLTEIDATDPRVPALSPAIAVPGLLLAARRDLLYTAVFPTAPARGTTLHVLRRRAGGVDVIGTIVLGGVGFFDSVVIEGEAAFAVAGGEILAIDLHNPARPALIARVPFAEGAGSRPYILGSGPGLLLVWGSGIASYRYGASLVPALDRLVEKSWARTNRIFPEAGLAFVPRGPSGVETFTLDHPAPDDPRPRRRSGSGPARQAVARAHRWIAYSGRAMQVEPSATVREYRRGQGHFMV